MTRRAQAAASASLLVALTFLGLASMAAAAARSPPASAASTFSATDTARLHYVKEAGSQLIDEGAATGTIPGHVRVSFNVGVAVAATFTIYAQNGSIVGHGTGTLHKNQSQSDVYVSFGGTMTVSHGTGSYAHAHGKGGFYGVIDRRNYAITIQTTGTLSY